MNTMSRQELAKQRALFQAQGQVLQKQQKRPGLILPTDIQEEIRAQQNAPKEGPGTELKRLLEKLGFFGFENCDCVETANWMNSVGPDVCRLNVDAIKKKLQDSKRFISWWQLAWAGLQAIKSGIALRMDLNDPVGWLVKEAIDRSDILRMPVQGDTSG